MGIFLFLLGYSFLMISIESASRDGRLGRLRAYMMRPIQTCPEKADRATDGGALVLGLILIFTAMATAQSLIDAL